MRRGIVIIQLRTCNEWLILSTILIISLNFPIHQSWLVSVSGLLSADLCLLHHLHGWEHMLRQHSNDTVCQVIICPRSWDDSAHVSPNSLLWWVCLHPLFARSNIPDGEYILPNCRLHLKFKWLCSSLVYPTRKLSHLEYRTTCI